MEQCDACLAGELPSLWSEPTPPETATFDYLTDTEFKMQIEVIVEGFTPLRTASPRERAQTEKLWKEREKQIDRVCSTPPAAMALSKKLRVAPCQHSGCLD